MSAKCIDCGRKVSTDSIGTELCPACLEYAGWENTHSDFDHNGSNEGDETTEHCPVCHPELDPRKPRRAVTGTSRLGMVMVVPVRAAGADKAASVKAHLAGFRTKLSEETHGIYFTGSKGSKASKVSFEANWDARGRWTGGTVNGKKVRNAAELVRLALALSA